MLESTQSIVTILKSNKKYNVIIEETDLEEDPYYRRIYDKIHQIHIQKTMKRLWKCMLIYINNHRNQIKRVSTS